jgi:hypothetical protein
MRLPVDAVISPTKVANYLLAWRPENDKSRFLAQAGYDAADPDRLADDIRRQLLPLEAEFEEETDYGRTFRIGGTLNGPNGGILREHLDDRACHGNNEVHHALPSEGELTWLSNCLQRSR